MEKPRLTLEKWFPSFSVDRDTGELDYFRIMGNVHDHPRLGTNPIYTSRVIKVNPDLGSVETLNSVYELLDMAPAFKEFLDKEHPEVGSEGYLRVLEEDDNKAFDMFSEYLTVFFKKTAEGDSDPIKYSV